MESALFDKIYGCWGGKVIGGTFGMPIEGKTRDFIRKEYKNIPGWSGFHKPVVNDDEQFELITLNYLEELSDVDLNTQIFNQTLFLPQFLGDYWRRLLIPQFVFTAEKYALENATKYDVPWEFAASEIYELKDGTNRYQNPFFDYIGAQMKGELYGMLFPFSATSGLRFTLNFAFNESQIAHRGIGIMGELFIAAMVAIAINYTPFQQQIEMKMPEIDGDEGIISKLLPVTGVASEVILEDLKNVIKVLREYAIEKSLLTEEESSLFFPYLEEPIDFYENNREPIFYEESIDIFTKKWDNDLEKLKESEKKRLKDSPEGIKQRLEVLETVPWVHTLPNISFIIIALLYGDGDMIQTIRIASESGMDTDCNAGNAGAILGAYIGFQLITPYAKRFIRNEMLPALNNWDILQLNDLAERTLRQNERIQKILKNM